jgi:hypothetical protein
MVSSGKIEMRDIQPGDPYGFNLTLVYHQWLGERYDVVDLFFLGAEVILEDDRPRKLVNLEVRRLT